MYWKPCVDSVCGVFRITGSEAPRATPVAAGETHTNTLALPSPMTPSAMPAEACSPRQLPTAHSWTPQATEALSQRQGNLDSVSNPGLRMLWQQKADSHTTLLPSV